MKVFARIPPKPTDPHALRKAFTLRSWATPLTIGGFILMSTTGVAMFFGWDGSPTMVVHQWFSWLFLAGAGGHVAANLRPLQNHLKSGLGKASVAAFAVVLVASFFPWGLITGPQLQRPIKMALLDAPLASLASATRTGPDALLLKLSARGIAATGQETIRDISARHGVGVNRLLAIVFLPD